MFFTAFTASTEIYEVGVSSQWREVSPLPNKMNEAAAVTLNNKIYLTGMYIHERERETEVDGGARN